MLILVEFAENIFTCLLMFFITEHVSVYNIKDEEQTNHKI